MLINQGSFGSAKSKRFAVDHAAMCKPYRNMSNKQFESNRIAQGFLLGFASHLFSAMWPNEKCSKHIEKLATLHSIVDHSRR
jgi:hypothetical protein